jgi:hypothetical protein|tara:strand:+ start:1302 stop:1781 length:480 start_codon:yes stop_codon:yes gene_type:complete
MKTYKELQEKIDTIAESGGGEVVNGGAARSARDDSGIHRVEDEEQVGRLNAFLNAFTDKEFLSPKTAMVQIRHKLNTSGLDFEWNNSSTVTNETMNLPLQRWGGSFGTTPTHDLKTGFYRGDNIKEFNNGVGLSLRINANQEDGGLYLLDAKIVPSMEG